MDHELLIALQSQEEKLKDMLRKSLQPTKGHYCEDIYYPKCGALHIQLYDVLDVNPLDLVF